MALKKEALEKLKSTLKGFDVDKLIAAAIAPDEQDYEIPADVNVLTTTELTTRDENSVKKGKTEGETIGETKGKEIIVKKIAKKFGFDDKVITEIGTDEGKLEAAVQTKFKAGDAGLQEQVNKLLQDKDQWVIEKQQLEAKAEEAGNDARLISMFPANRTTDIPNNELLTLIKMNLTFEKQADGTTVVKRNGAIVEDTNTHAPLPVDKVIASFFTERKWAGEGGPGDGGRGGGNNPGGGGGTGGHKKLSAFTEAWKAENPGKNEISPEFDTALQAHVAKHQDFDYNA